MPWCSPLADVELVMSVEGASVEDESFSGLCVHGRVTIPAVAVEEAGLDAAAFRLEGQE